MGVPSVIHALKDKAPQAERLLRILGVFDSDNFPGRFLIECAAVATDDIQQTQYEEVRFSKCMIKTSWLFRDIVLADTRINNIKVYSRHEHF